jgi:hypothetical protein
VNLVSLVALDEQELLVHLDHLDHLVREDHLGKLATQGQQVDLVIMDQLAHLENQVYNETYFLTCSSAFMCRTS